MKKEVREYHEKDIKFLGSVLKLLGKWVLIMKIKYGSSVIFEFPRIYVFSKFEF